MLEFDVLVGDLNVTGAIVAGWMTVVGLNLSKPEQFGREPTFILILIKKLEIVVSSRFAVHLLL